MQSSLRFLVQLLTQWHLGCKAISHTLIAITNSDPVGSFEGLISASVKLHDFTILK